MPRCVRVEVIDRLAVQGRMDVVSTVVLGAQVAWLCRFPSAPNRAYFRARPTSPSATGEMGACQVGLMVFLLLVLSANFESHVKISPRLFRILKSSSLIFGVPMGSTSDSQGSHNIERSQQSSLAWPRLQWWDGELSGKPSLYVLYTRYPVWDL